MTETDTWTARETVAAGIAMGIVSLTLEAVVDDKPESRRLTPVDIECIADRVLLTLEAEGYTIVRADPFRHDDHGAPDDN
jgi:hypothetical protein